MSSSIDLQAKVKADSAAGGLSAEEGFLWSRVSTEMKVSELLSLCPWEQEKSLKILESLIQKKCLILEGRAEEPPKENLKKESPTPESQTSQASKKEIPKVVVKAIYEQLEMDRFDIDTRDLDERFRKEVLFYYFQLETLHEFELLDIRLSASDHEVKNSYLKLSRKFHPDRFFRKKMGPYSKFLNSVFSKIQLAYETIKNPHDREALARQIKRREKEKNSPAGQANTSKKNLNRKMDPELEKIGKAEKYFKLGQEAKANGRYLEAANHFLLASQMNPTKVIYQKAHEDVEPFVLRERSIEMMKNARAALEVGMIEDALLYAEQALRANPEEHEAGLLAAKCILDLVLNDRLDDALQMLRRARANLPRNGDVCFQLGRLYQAQGELEKAKVELHEALRRDPKLSRAKKLLEKID